MRTGNINSWVPRILLNLFSYLLTYKRWEISLSNRNRRDYDILKLRWNCDFIWEKGTLNLRRKHRVSIKTNAINKFFRVENIHIPNLILIDFYVVALSAVKDGQKGWFCMGKSVHPVVMCIWWSLTLTTVLRKVCKSHIIRYNYQTVISCLSPNQPDFYSMVRNCRITF